MVSRMTSSVSGSSPPTPRNGAPEGARIDRCSPTPDPAPEEPAPPAGRGPPGTGDLFPKVLNGTADRRAQVGRDIRRLRPRIALKRDTP